jgi:hypothetical protein
MKRIIVFITALFLASAASAVTLDFSDVPPGQLIETNEYGGVSASFIYEGYKFFSYSEEDFYLPLLQGAAVACSDPVACTGISMVATDYESEFDLYGFEANYFPSPYDLTVTGYYGDGNLLFTETFRIDSSRKLIEFTASGLTRLDFTSANSPAIILNSVSVSAIPVPASVWLFGSALTGLGWLRRKQSGLS